MWYRGGKQRGAKLRVLEREAVNGVSGDNIYHHGDAVKSLEGALMPGLECDLFAVLGGRRRRRRHSPPVLTFSFPRYVTVHNSWLRWMERSGQREGGAWLFVELSPPPVLKASPQDGRLSATTKRQDVSEDGDQGNPLDLLSLSLRRGDIFWCAAALSPLQSPCDGCLFALSLPGHRCM